MLKPRHNESLTHLFVTYDTAEYLESKGIKVQKYVTVKPDIVFELNGKRCAIEIETGSVLTKVKNMKEKVKMLNKNYDEWFFVVTNKNKVLEYKKFGGSVDLRYLKKKLQKYRRQKKKSHSA